MYIVDSCHGTAETNTKQLYSNFLKKVHTLLWKSLDDLGQGASHTAVLPAFSERWGKGCWSHLR